MTEQNQIPELFNVSDAADAMRCSKQKVYKLCDDGDIPSFKLNGKIVMRAEAVREWIRQAEEKQSCGDQESGADNTKPSEDTDKAGLDVLSRHQTKQKLLAS